MAGELQLAHGTTGRTLYAVVRDTAGLVWNVTESAFETYSAPGWASYATVLTEQGASGYYVGDMPAVPAGAYPVEVRSRAGADPAVTDTPVGEGTVEWSGSAIVPLATRSSQASVAALPSAAAILAAIEGAVVDGALTRLQAERLVLAALAGNTSPDGTTYYAPGTTTPRLVVATAGADGRTVTGTP